MKFSVPVAFEIRSIEKASENMRECVHALIEVIVGIIAVVLAAFTVVSLLTWTSSAFAENIPSNKPASQTSKAVVKPKPPVIATTSKTTDAEEATTQRAAELPQRFTWDKTPITVVLGIGPNKERRITFPTSMFIGLPAEIASVLRVQTVDRTSYFTAVAPFPKTRIVAEDRMKGNVILLDVSAAQGASSMAPLEISLPTIQKTSLDSARQRNGTEEDGEAIPYVDYVTLTRFAAKQLYAPRRLATDFPGVRRISLNDAPVIGLYRGASLKATPIAAWRGDSLYVSAVKLENQSREPIELNPLDVRGGWLSITFQHGRLLGKGDESDTTVVYLTCDRAFEECH